jgi:MFS family permease
MLSKAESILLWSSNLWILGWGMFGTLFAVFAERVGANVLSISWVYAVNLGVTGLGIIVVGKIADRYGHERLLVGGYALSVVATFGYLVVDSVMTLFVVQLGMSIATALMTPTWYALYDRHSGDGSRDGYVWGLFSGMGFIVQGIGLMLGGYLVTAYSWNTLFMVMGIVLTISTLYEARILRYRVQ